MEGKDSFRNDFFPFFKTGFGEAMLPFGNFARFEQRSRRFGAPDATPKNYEDRTRTKNIEIMS